MSALLVRMMLLSVPSESTTLYILYAFVGCRWNAFCFGLDAKGRSCSTGRMHICLEETSTFHFCSHGIHFWRFRPSSICRIIMPSILVALWNCCSIFMLLYLIGSILVCLGTIHYTSRKHLTAEIFDLLVSPQLRTSMFAVNHLCSRDKSLLRCFYNMPSV